MPNNIPNEITAAQTEAKRILKEAGVWVENAHAATPLSRALCAGWRLKLWDALMGAAKECYCCAFLRGCLYGFLAGLGAAFIVFLLA